MITQFINRADTNKDGVISFDEFVQSVLQDSKPGKYKLLGNDDKSKIEISGNKFSAKGPRYEDL